jgi:hypothetical protein
MTGKVTLGTARWTGWLAVATTLIGAAAPAAAYTNFRLDELRVEWANAATNVGYLDGFDNGDPLVGGTFTNRLTGGTSTGSNFVTTRSGQPPQAGSESGGKLRVAWSDMPDSTFGGAVVGRSLNYFLGTSTQYSPGADLQNRGLWKGNDFAVEAVWDLTVPLAGDAARLRLWDAFDSHASNDLLDLNLLTIGGDLHVRSRRLFILPGQTDELTLVNVSSLVGDANQVGLTFRHLAGEDFVTAGLIFYRDGVSRGGYDIGNLSLFNGEEWTRVSFGTFAATAPIPEPQTYALMLLGLAAVGVAARRRR